MGEIPGGRTHTRRVRCPEKAPYFETGRPDGGGRSGWPIDCVSACDTSEVLGRFLGDLYLQMVGMTVN